MALLIVMGLAGGAMMPSLIVLIAAWIPERERSKLGGFVMSGSPVRKPEKKNQSNFESKLGLQFRNYEILF